MAQPDGVARVLPRSDGSDSTDSAIDDVWRDSWLGAGGVGTAEPVSLLGHSEWSVTAVGGFAPDVLDSTAGAAQRALNLYRPVPPVRADALSPRPARDRPLPPQGTTRSLCGRTGFGVGVWWPRRPLDSLFSPCRPSVREGRIGPGGGRSGGDRLR
ncbi:hypothetical protein GCM10027605_29020 [Micromonospora zhanjiangensis]